MEKIKVRQQAKKHIDVHNDLSNAAYHFNKKVNERLANNDRAGIAFDILAELIFLAFTMEAKNKLSGDEVSRRLEGEATFPDQAEPCLGASSALTLILVPDHTRRSEL